MIICSCPEIEQQMNKMIIEKDPMRTRRLNL